MLRSAINSDDVSPGSASGRASIALRRPAKAKPVSCCLKLAAEVCSRCSPQLCWFACGNDNTNASYSGRTALHPGPRRCAPRAGIRRSCPLTWVVLSTLVRLRSAVQLVDSEVQYSVFISCILAFVTAMLKQHITFAKQKLTKQNQIKQINR